MKTIQLPDAVYEEIAELAAVDKVSVDKMAAVLLHEHVGEWSKIQTCAARSSIEKLPAPTRMQFPLFGIEGPKVELTNDIIYEQIEFP